MSLKEKLFAAARANAGLQALLLSGSPAIFGWYDTQLPQGIPFPAVTVQLISNPRVYALTGRLPTSWVRLQLSIYTATDDSTGGELVVQAILAFLAQFNAIGISPLVVYPNTVVGDRDGGLAQTDPLTFMRILDVMMLNNENV